MAIALRHSRLIPSGMSFVAYLAAAEAFLDGLLDGETDGFAIDATDYDTLIPAAYVGGPVGGDVLVGESGVPSLDHVPLDSSNLVQSGTSPKMVHFDEAPYVRWSPHNKVWTSNDFTHEDWANEQATVTANAAVAPDGTTTAASAVATGSGNKIMNSDAAFTAQSAVAYTISVYAKPFNTNWIVLELTDDTADAFGAFFDVNSGATGATGVFGTGSLISKTITSAGNGWYRCAVTGTFSADNAISRFNAKVTSADNTNPANTDSAYLWGPQIVRGYEALPYLVNTASADRIGIPQAYDAYEDCFGILVEPAATNLCLDSEELDTTSWNTFNIAVDDQFTSAPDGATTADKLTAANVAGGSLLYSDDITTSASTTYTASVYAKAGTNQYFTVSFPGASTANRWVAATFDLTNGTMTQSTAGAGGTLVGASVTAIGNGWYRCSVTGSHGDAASQLYLQINNSGTPTLGNSSTQSWTPAGTETIYAWGAQLELGSVATSYIPTLGSTVTRAVDNIKAATSSWPLGATEQSMFAHMLDIATGNKTFLAISETTGDDSLLIGRDSPATNVFSAAFDENVSQAGFVAGTNTQGASFKVAARYKANDFHAALDGTLSGAPDTSGTFPTTLDNFQFNYGTETFAHCMYYRIVLVPRALDNTELQTVTAA
jgi:hypothetical protein